MGFVDKSAAVESLAEPPIGLDVKASDEDKPSVKDTS